MIFIFWVKFSDFTFLEIEKNDIHFLEKNDIHFQLVPKDDIYFLGKIRF